jgi:hypothetical protein
METWQKTESVGEKNLKKASEKVRDTLNDRGAKRKGRSVFRNSQGLLTESKD